MYERNNVWKPWYCKRERERELHFNEKKCIVNIEKINKYKVEKKQKDINDNNIKAKNSNQGITLISLVITIVVLIILASISIAMITRR